ncbi:hypothetical protein GCK32_010577 [Trichostrongylus colubriformis]|uniref:Uncharacterized protein n=1 Tax=Trichostrongylus colubriformis TaxID=6319 RepID=A0AAN8EXJ1_TRICO
MKKRREKKLETRLKEMGHGGSLKIYGGELVPSRPYVTILVSMYDRVEKILVEALEKYGIDPSSAIDYMLVEMPVSEQTSRSFNDLRNLPSDGRVMSADEAPLMQMAAKNNGYPETYLALRRKPNRGSRVVIQNQTNNASDQADVISSSAKEPSLHFLAPDGSPMNPPRALTLSGGVTEVGSDRALAQFSAQNICLNGAEMRGRHCVITYMDGIVTITPSASDAIIEVNNRRIGQTEILRDGDLLRMGQSNLFRFMSSHKFLSGMVQVVLEKNSIPASLANWFRFLPKLCVGNVLITMRRYASANGLLESVYDPQHSKVTSHQLKALLSGSSSTSRQLPDQVDSAPMVQTLAPLGTPQTFNGMPSSGTAPNLPLSLQIGDYKVWDYLVEVMSRGWMDAGPFRLSPAYSLYLALRFFQSHSKPYLVQFFTRIAHHMNQISQTVFRRLCTVLLGALRPACKPMLDANIPIEDGSNEILSLLDGTLRAARASRLNAALTIQLCSHVLHAINATIFNSLVGVSSAPVRLTTRLGKCLQARLAALHGWAEQMGVELAAECHLDRSRQAAALLAAQKNDVAALGATCYKLNSLQVRYLLTHFCSQDGEIPCDSDVIARIVGLAERQADHLTLQDGHPITLAESEQLLLPFLLPQDGYTAGRLERM